MEREVSVSDSAASLKELHLKNMNDFNGLLLQMNHWFLLLKSRVHLFQ